MSRALNAIKAAAAFVFWRWPFGSIYRVADGKGYTIRVTKSLWVITSDGLSEDALPLSFCSEALVDRVAVSIQSRWWYVPPKTEGSATPSSTNQGAGK